MSRGIGQLANDVLVLAFQRLTPLQILRHVACVCSLWRDLAFKDRSFWGTVTVSPHDDHRHEHYFNLLILQLERRPPDARWNLELDASGHHTCIQSFRQIVLPKVLAASSRLVRLDLRMPVDLPILKQLETFSADNLEIFKLKLVPHPYGFAEAEIPVDIFKGHAPHLRVIVFSNLRSVEHAHYAAFSQVTTLAFRRAATKADAVPFPISLFDSCPRLAVVSLADGPYFSVPQSLGIKFVEVDLELLHISPLALENLLPAFFAISQPKWFKVSYPMITAYPRWDHMLRLRDGALRVEVDFNPAARRLDGRNLDKSAPLALTMRNMDAAEDDRMVVTLCCGELRDGARDDPNLSRIFADYHSEIALLEIRAQLWERATPGICLLLNLEVVVIVMDKVEEDICRVAPHYEPDPLQLPKLERVIIRLTACRKPSEILPSHKWKAFEGRFVRRLTTRAPLMQPVVFQYQTIQSM